MRESAVDRAMRRHADVAAAQVSAQDAIWSDAFAAHLAKHAPEYYADLSGPVSVRLQARTHRPVSTFYEFTLADRRASRSVLVKVQSGPAIAAVNTAAALHDRPRRVSCPAPAQKTQLEFEALTRLHDYFGELNDPRFGSIRPLDLITPPGAIAMEKAGDPRLGRLMLRPYWFRGGAGMQRRGVALRNAGAWLAAWHRYPFAESHEPTMSTVAEFAEFTSLLTGYLSSTAGQHALFARARERVIEKAFQVLPRALPLAITHNDYAPRNVLVAANGRVTVLDTLARHRAPVYADVAHFLMSLETAGPQVQTHGLWFSRPVLEAWRGSFVQGYYETSPVPTTSITLFEIQMVLDKWAAVMLRSKLGGASVASRQRTWQWNVFLERYLKRLLTTLALED